MRKKFFCYILTVAMMIGSLQTIDVYASETPQEVGQSEVENAEISDDKSATNESEQVENEKVEESMTGDSEQEGESSVEESGQAEGEKDKELVTEENNLNLENKDFEVQDIEGEEQQEKPEEMTELDILADAHRDDLQDGTYFIRTQLSNDKIVSIKGDSANARVDAVIRKFEKKSTQKWKVVHDEKGYVTFINEGNGKVLDVFDGGRSSDRRVWQYHSNNSLAQKWIVQREGNFCRILSAINGMSLDVRGGKSSDNTILQIYKTNNVAAQYFQMISVNPHIEKCEEIIPSGYYYMCSKINPEYAIDIYGGSDKNGANVQLYKANNSFAQAFEICYEDGYYTIRNMYSNKVLDVYDGGFMPSTNVWQYKFNGTKAQKWTVEQNDDGSYTFINVNNGMALDCRGGKAGLRVNIQVYTPNGSNAQKFVLKEAKDFYPGYYSIVSAADSNKAVEIAGGNMSNKTNVQLYRKNGTESQKWIARQNSDKTYGFVNSKSGKLMDVAGGKIEEENIVWAHNYNGSVAQKWKVEKLKDHTWRIVSAKDNEYVLGLSKGALENKTKIVIQKWNDSINQKWIFQKVNISKHPIGVELAEGKEYVLEKGNSHKLQGKVIYTQGEGKSLIWKSSDPSVVSVSDSGVIKALKHGNALITATSKENKNFSVSVKVYVKEIRGQISRMKLDSLNLKDTKNLMIVAHPDDETFWGGGHLLEDKWFVVCVTNGKNKTRNKEFKNAMRYSGDKFLILDYADYNDEKVRDDWKYAEGAIRNDIKLLVGYQNWNKIVVHNPDGEYGHIHHKMLSKYTAEICKEKKLFNKLYYFGKFYWTVPDTVKSNLSKKTIAKKKEMIKKYPSQMTSYNNVWKQMEKHEHWIKATNW